MPILRPWKYWILQSPRFHLILLIVVVEAAVRRNIWELWCLNWMPPHFTACELLLKSGKVDLMKSGGRISVNTYSACFRARSGAYCVVGELVVHKILVYDLEYVNYFQQVIELVQLQ
jgi:hypothetical protein